METLTDHECSEWLATRGLTQDPYSLPNRGKGPYLQIPLPCDSFSRGIYFLTNLVLLNEPFKTALLPITDWAHYTPDQMAVFTRFRRSSGEERWLIDAPGHVFREDEVDRLVGWMGLIAAYKWTAYVYFDHGLTLLLWEGVLMDLWCADAERFKLNQNMLEAWNKPE